MDGSSRKGRVETEGRSVFMKKQKVRELGWLKKGSIRHITTVERHVVWYEEQRSSPVQSALVETTGSPHVQDCATAMRRGAVTVDAAEELVEGAKGRLPRRPGIGLRAPSSKGGCVCAHPGRYREYLRLVEPRVCSQEEGSVVSSASRGWIAQVRGASSLARCGSRGRGGGRLTLSGSLKLLFSAHACAPARLADFFFPIDGLICTRSAAVWMHVRR